MPCIHSASAGYKGLVFVSGLLANGIRPNRIISYSQAGDQSDALPRLVKLSRAPWNPILTRRIAQTSTPLDLYS